VVFRKEPFGGILYDRETFTYAPINSLGYRVVAWLAKGSDLTALTAHLAREFSSVPPSVIGNDVAAFMQELFKQGFLECLPEGWVPELETMPLPSIPRYSPEFILLPRTPLIVSLAIIFTCNLRCAHCYTSSTTEQKPDSLTTPEILRIIQEICDAQVFDLVITGGEPLLHKDIFHILHYAKDRGLHVCLNSNGVCLTKEVAKRLADSGVDRVRISLDSPIPQIHDSFRGLCGAWRATIRGVQNLIAEGLRTEIHTTISLRSLRSTKDVDELIRLCRDLGVARVNFGKISNIGRAEAQHLKLENHYLGELLDYIRELKNKEPLIGGLPMKATPHIPELPDYDGCGRCANGLFAYINYNGTVYPCTSMYKPQWALGNLREESFLSLWSDSSVLRNLRKLFGKSGKTGAQLICGE
jgi:MoaA/NifB/PqqE/SkfB family radical SAM enzyme